MKQEETGCIKYKLLSNKHVNLDYNIFDVKIIYIMNEIIINNRLKTCIRFPLRTRNKLFHT